MSVLKRSLVLQKVIFSLLKIRNDIVEINYKKYLLYLYSNYIQPLYDTTVIEQELNKFFNFVRME